MDWRNTNASRPAAGTRRPDSRFGSDDETLHRVGDGLAPTRADDTADPPAPCARALEDYAPGDVIRDRFRLERLLGQGGMGRVFLATDLKKEKFEDRDPYVAIKFLGCEFSEHPQARMALQRETRNAQRLSHPNIVKVFDFDEHGHSVYMTMEYIRGAALDGFLRERAQAGLPFDDIWPIVRGMGLGLSYIHSQGMVHADFKPGNVFVGEDGTAKLLDLGIARVWKKPDSGDRSTRFDPGALGAITPEYASCEMFEGLEPDPRDDVYALGCVTYQLLTGRHPFGREWSIKARARKAALEPVLRLGKRRWRALCRALAFNREDRTESVDRFLEEFEARRDFSKARLAAAAVAGSIAAAALVWGMIPVADPDEAFVESLLQTAGVQPVTEVEERNIDNWLAQGNAYVEFARESFQNLDAESGDRDLRSGPDNAESAFRGVLALSPSNEAAQGLLDIVNAYAFGADRFAASGDRWKAFWLACQGLKIHDDHARLRGIVEELSPGVAERDLARMPCNDLATQLAAR